VSLYYYARQDTRLKLLFYFKMSTDKYEHKHDLKASPHHFCLYHLLLFAQVPLSHHEHRETFLCYHLTNGLRTFLIFLPKKLRRNIQKIFPKTMSFQRIWDNVPNQQKEVPCTGCAFLKSNCWCTECKRKGFKKPIRIIIIILMMMIIISSEAFNKI